MVRGHLKFDNPGAVPTGQRIKVRVEDTSRIGASSVTVAEAEVEIPEDFDADSDALPFEIDLAETRDGYSLRAHMPRHAGDDIREGDMITTASIPVSKDDELDVILKKV